MTDAPQHVADKDVSELPLQEFIKILHQMPQDKINKIDVRYVPEVLPDDFIDNFAIEKKAAIEQLLFDTNAYYVARRQVLIERFGETVPQGMQLASQPTSDVYSLKLKQLLKLMLESYNKNKEENHKKQQTIYESWFDKAEVIMQQIDERLGEYSKAIYALKSQLKNAEEFLARFRIAIHKLESKIDSIENIRGLYFYVKLVMMSNIMLKLRNSFADLDAKSRVMQMQIDVAREELKNFQSKGRLSAEEKERQLQLEAQISNHIEEMKNYEVIVSEQELLSWLNIIVEASINKTASIKGKQAIRSSRLTLFSLLQRYCELQELAAKQVARNPFTQADPKKTIQFLMQSEEFVLEFFARKKSSLSAWLGGAAEEKIKSLEKMESELLVEMKQNTKKLR